MQTFELLAHAGNTLSLLILALIPCIAHFWNYNMWAIWWNVHNSFTASTWTCWVCMHVCVCVYVCVSVCVCVSELLSIIRQWVRSRWDFKSPHHHPGFYLQGTSPPQVDLLTLAHTTWVVPTHPNDSSLGRRERLAAVLFLLCVCMGVGACIRVCEQDLIASIIAKQPIST